jgi:hypothetical protein
MTAEEMLYRAEVSYDFITGFSAASISKKEWSLFLTTAQLDVIKKKLPVKQTDDSFEETELLFEQFSELVTDAIDDNGNLTTKKSINQYGGIDPSSMFFDLPSDFLYGLVENVDYEDEECISSTEKIVTTSWTEFAEYYNYDGDSSTATDTDKDEYADSLENQVIDYDIEDDLYTYFITESVYKKYKVKPINHNYYIANIKNPHKKPFKDLAWRIKYKSSDGIKRHELISSYKINNYYLRYLKMPTPIIVFDDDYDGDMDEIQGVVLNSVYTSGSSIDSILSDTVCDTIINRAVMLAQMSLGDFQSAQIKAMDSSSLN